MVGCVGGALRVVVPWGGFVWVAVACVSGVELRLALAAFAGPVVWCGVAFPIGG